jgi:hypothetical protein
MKHLTSGGYCKGLGHFLLLNFRDANLFTRNLGHGRRLSFNIWLDMTTRCISEVPS